MKTFLAAAETSMLLHEAFLFCETLVCFTGLIVLAVSVGCLAASAYENRKRDAWLRSLPEQWENR